MDTYFCDFCTNKKTGEPFSCFKSYDWDRHLLTDQHVSKCLDREKQDDDKYCKVCFTHMPKESFKRHKDRNLKMLKFKYNLDLEIFKQCSCNNFIYNNKRFDGFESLRDYASMHPPLNFIEEVVDPFWNSLPKEVRDRDPFHKNKNNENENNSDDDYDCGKNAYFSIDKNKIKDKKVIEI